MWKNIASFVLGAAIGGSAVYFAMKDKFKAEEEEAISSIREYYSKKESERDKETAKNLNEVKEQIAESLVAKVEKEQEEYKSYATMYDHESSRKPKEGKSKQKDISKHDAIKQAMDEYEEELEDDSSLINFDGYSDPVEEGPTEPAPIPFAISPNDFANGRLYYEKKDLRYYDVDDVLVDEYYDEVIDDLKNTVGAGFKSKFDIVEKDVAYIRNEKAETDYSIIRIHGSYYPPEEEE